MGDGLVSVIIPTYNRAGCIARAIDSVLKQTHADVEVLVIDDGSTDTTRALVLDTYGKDERVRYVYQENRGVSAARNHGIRLVRGSFAALLDSDDAWMPFKLELQLACLGAFPDAGMVWTDMTATGPDGKVHSERYLKTFYSSYRWFSSQDLFDRSLPLAEVAPGLAQGVGDSRAYSGDIYAQMILGNLVHTSTVLLRRERLEQVGFFDESCRSGEDHEFHLNTCRAGRVAFADVCSIFYQIGAADQLTQPKYKVEMARKFLTTMTAALARDREQIRLPQSMIDRALEGAHRWMAEALITDGRWREAQPYILDSLRLNLRQPRLIGLYAGALLPAGLRERFRDAVRRMRNSVS